MKLQYFLSLLTFALYFPVQTFADCNDFVIADEEEGFITLTDQVSPILMRMDRDNTEVFESENTPVSIYENEEGEVRGALLGPLELVHLCQNLKNDNLIPKKSLDSMGAPEYLKGDDTGFTLSIDTCLDLVFEKYEISFDYSNYLVTEIVGKKTNGKTPQEFVDVRDFQVTFVKREEEGHLEGYFVLEYRDASSKREDLVKLQDSYHHMINSSKFYENVKRDREERNFDFSYGKRFKVSDNELGYKLSAQSDVGLSSQGDAFIQFGSHAEKNFFDERLNLFADYNQRFSSGDYERKEWKVGTEACFKEKVVCMSLSAGDFEDKYTKEVPDDDIIFTIGLSTRLKF